MNCAQDTFFASCILCISVIGPLEHNYVEMVYLQMYKFVEQTTAFIFLNFNSATIPLTAVCEYWVTFLWQNLFIIIVHKILILFSFICLIYKTI